VTASEEASPLKILIVEDDPAIRRLLSDLLLDEGYEVRTESDGSGALDSLVSWLPNLVMLDLSMPGMDGRAFRASQRMLSEPARHVPVLLVTGIHDPGRVVDELDVAGLIRKPFDIDEVTELVASLARKPERPG
jgi:CheY-like chemotaxis protein